MRHATLQGRLANWHALHCRSRRHHPWLRRRRTICTQLHLPAWFPIRRARTTLGRAPASIVIPLHKPRIEQRKPDEETYSVSLTHALHYIGGRSLWTGRQMPACYAGTLPVPTAHHRITKRTASVHEYVHIVDCRVMEFCHEVLTCSAGNGSSPPFLPSGCTGIDITTTTAEM